MLCLIALAEFLGLIAFGPIMSSLLLGHNLRGRNLPRLIVGSLKVSPFRRCRLARLDPNLLAAKAGLVLLCLGAASNLWLYCAPAHNIICLVSADDSSTNQPPISGGLFVANAQHIRSCARFILRTLYITLY